jgi:membrane protein
MIRRLRDTWRRMRRVFLIRFALTVAERFGRDNGAFFAAGLAFFLIVAFVPMLLTSIAALGYYIHVTHASASAMTEVKRLLMTQFLPGAAGHEAQHLIDRADVSRDVTHIADTRRISGIVGFLGLVWASIQINLNAAVAMNTTWRVQETRNWFRVRLTALALLAIQAVFLALSLAATAYGTWLSASVIAQVVPGWDIVVNIGMEIGATAGAAVMFALAYRYLPAVNVSWRCAFVGGVSAAIAWEIAKKGLAVYLLHPNVSLYGNLANLIIFILWLYYSMTIMLLGAEVCAVYATEVEEKLRARLRRAAKSDPSADTTLATTTNHRSGRGQVTSSCIEPDIDTRGCQ